MGENEGWAEPDGSMLSGLLPGAGSVMQAVDTERWLKAEERIAELIACIQPNQLSEERRNAVADYVQRLIENCFPCQKVCTFGSVPLKTYLPDGDIDLTAFSQNQNLKDTWANYVRDILENEEKNENAEFHVKEVQYIQAEVKIIKCLVENIVVDISFNQVGGLCTLCFLDEVDAMIKQNHLFKRSIILIKAWCYYESRILGAHHGLISTYALETLVLYIFHVFSNPFHGPLEVLYRFLEFFSNFDWDNFCVSLWGPVPISALPDVTAEPPRKDSGELLLSKRFLDACTSAYAVYSGGHENNGQPFVSKHFNVIDPLRVNNNLGRSVSKGNFFRIQSAFAFGANKLSRLLSCPKENIVFEVNQFFMNTLKRHGTGHRPDAPGIDSRSLRLSTLDSPQKFKISNNNTNRKKQNESSSVKQPNSTSLDVTDKIKSQVVLKDEVQREMKVGQLVNDTNGRNLFARTRSSPELTNTYGDLYSKIPLTKAESANAPSWLENSNRTKKLGSESLAGHSRRSSVEDASSMRNIPSQPSLDKYQQELRLDEDFLSSRTHIMNQEEQDNVNMAAISSIQGFNGQFHLPFNLTSGPQPFPVPPYFFASMGYNTQRNFPGFAPNNFPFIDLSFQNMHFPQGLVSPELTHYFPNFRLNTPCDDSVEQTNENFGHVEMNSVEPDSDFWQKQDVGSSGGYEPENEHFDLRLQDDKPTKSLPGLKYVPPFRINASARVQQKNSQEKRDNIDSFLIQDTRNDEVYAEERSTNSRLSSATHNNSLRSKTPSSESSWDGSVTPKSTKEKRGKKLVSKDIPAGHEKAKILSGHLSNQADDDDQDWSSLLNREPESISSLQVSTPHIEVPQMNGSDSMTPFAPMLIRPGSWQRGSDNSGTIPLCPSGPSIPFLIYNAPADKGSFDASTPRFGLTSDTTEPGQNFSPRGFDQLDHFNSPSSFKGTAAIETSEEQNSHILNSDFDSHLRNLKIGRFCQNPQPLFYPSPVMVPPVYLQGRFPYPYDNTGRPLSTNSNILPQLMTSNGQCLVPGSPVQPVSDIPSNIYQRYMDVSPRYRSGTGTYLPNPRLSAKERQSSSTRRRNYNNDRKDNYGDGNWNDISKSQGGSRNHTRSQTDKSNFRLASNDTRSWNSNRNDSIPLHQSQNNGPLQMSINGPSVPPVTMFYPFDHQSAATNDSHDEQLEFGSSSSIGFPGTNEQSQLNEGTRARAFEKHRFHGSSRQRSSPDQPSSPHHQREYSQRNRR